MRMLLPIFVVFAVVLGLGKAAHAQPGRQAPPPTAAPNYPGYGMRGQPNYSILTNEERRLLLHGEITGGEVVGGAILSGWIGFGLGHAVQGRWSETGWKFAAGESLAIGAVIVGAFTLIEAENRYGHNSNSESSSGTALLVGGMVGFSILRIWEFIDVIVGPASYNDRVRAARYKAYGGNPYPTGYSLYVVPTSNGGGVAGVSFRF